MIMPKIIFPIFLSIFLPIERILLSAIYYYSTLLPKLVKQEQII